MKKAEIKIEIYEEHDDGSATLTLDIPFEARELLINAGFNHVLQKYLDELENEQNTETTRS